MTPSPAIVLCTGCGAERWRGLGPCSVCGAPSPEWERETEAINKARAEAGMPPLTGEHE